MVDHGKDMSAQQRKKLSKKEFALPSKRKYPIPHKAHARNQIPTLTTTCPSLLTEHSPRRWNPIRRRAATSSVPGEKYL